MKEEKEENIIIQELIENKNIDNIDISGEKKEENLKEIEEIEENLKEIEEFSMRKFMMEKLILIKTIIVLILTFLNNLINNSINFIINSPTFIKLNNKAKVIFNFLINNLKGIFKFL
jgi:hypothetical protein